MNQPDTETQRVDILSEKDSIDTFNIKKGTTKQIARSEFFFRTPFVFQVFTEKQKVTKDAINFSENLVNNTANFLPFEKHCNDIY